MSVIEDIIEIILKFVLYRLILEGKRYCFFLDGKWNTESDHCLGRPQLSIRKKHCVPEAANTDIFLLKATMATT